MRRIAFLFCFFLVSFLTKAEVKLPSLVGDGMVIQRNTEIKIWGWASPNEKIKITFLNKSFKTKAGLDGKWSCILPAQSAGGPYEMTIKGKNEIKVSNILIGDVWFCSGQSNMVHQMQHHDVTYEQDIAEANNANIRQFLVPTLTNLDQQSDNYPDNVTWKECNPENVRQFSAIAYFFAKQLYEKYKIPIGIINASVGGTPIEAWTSADGLKDFSDLQTTIARNRDSTFINRFRRTGSPSVPEIKDKGLTGKEKWFSSNYIPKGWKPINIPGYWEDQGVKDLNGTVWYRREFDIPAKMTNKQAKVFLGRIVDADELYINGTLVGKTTYQYPQRRYKVPENLLKAGKNLFVVKVSNSGGKGGFVPDKPYQLIADKDTIELIGTWQYKVGEVYVPRFGGFGGGGFSAQNQPTALYNAMVAPANNFAIKGIVWYQGESNSGRPKAYEAFQKAQILDWRAEWNMGELPFIFVQLPNFMDANYLPSESQWAELRESQLKSLAMPNTAMAVAIDLGEWNDIHPDNKKAVGERVALAAEKLAYGENIVYSGPIFKTAEKNGNKITLAFDHVGSGLISKDGEDLREFALAGEDKKFVWANATIVGDKIELISNEVTSPMYIRYAWSDNPDVNFYNKAGLPASPFQTEIVGDYDKLWHGKQAAVVLTYDDALNVQLDNAIPALDARGLKGSFYLSGAFPGSRDRIEDWKRAARNGHELGNHTIYHPCDASLPGRSWVSPENDLSKYTTAKIVNEIRMDNIFLEALDGKKERTFAYTCGDTKTGEGSFIDAIAGDFIASRGTREKLNIIGSIDLKNIDCYGVNGQTGAQLIQWVKEAQEKNALLTILFHGVGGEHSLNVSLEAHKELLDYLESNKDKVWTTTMIEAAKHVKEHQN